MNKTTLIALATVVVLAIVVFFLTRQEEGPEARILALPGIHQEDPSKKKAEGAEEAADEEEEKAPKVGPADRIEVAGPQGTFVLVKQAEDRWNLEQPVQAPAEMYKVRGMLRAFDEPVSSNYSRAVSTEALEKLGLDEGNRIRITLKKGDEALVDLFVGRVDKKDDGGMDADTMVMLPEDLENPVYFRIPGVDLRRPFEAKLSELRGKKLFEFAKNEVTRIEVQDPRDTHRKRLVLVNKGSDGKDDWQMVEPSGIAVENLSGFVSSLVNARAEEYMSKLPGADATALDKAYRIAATIKNDAGERDVALLLGAGRKKGVYARVEGRDGYFLVATYSAKQLMKSFNDFRRKKLFDFKADDITAIELGGATREPLHVVRQGDGWTMRTPAGVPVATAKAKSLANGIANFRAAEFLEQDLSLAETGLETPELTLTAALAQSVGGGFVTLHVGKEFKNDEDQERYYARLEGDQEIFTVMRYSRENIAKGVADLKDMRVFRITKEEIVKFSLLHPDQTLHFERRNKDGNAVWHMTAPKEKADVQVTAMLATLASLDVDGVVPGMLPEKAGLKEDSFTIQVTLADGSEHSVTISEEVTENKNYAMTSTEADFANQVLLLSKYKVDNLTKKLPDFEK